MGGRLEFDSVPAGFTALILLDADFEPVGKMFDVEAVWRSMGNLVRAVPIADCGHLPQEEQPEVVNAELLEFLKDWRG